MLCAPWTVAHAYIELPLKFQKWFLNEEYFTGVDKADWDGRAISQTINVISSLNWNVSGCWLPSWERSHIPYRPRRWFSEPPQVGYGRTVPWRVVHFYKTEYFFWILLVCFSSASRCLFFLMILYSERLLNKTQNIFDDIGVWGVRLWILNVLFIACWFEKNIVVRTYTPQNITASHLEDHPT